MQPVFVPAGQVLSEATVVFAYDDDFHFGVLTSGFHYRWAVRYASSLETRVRYTPSDVFETFPQPPYSDAVASAGGELDAHRSRLMQDRDLGLTSIFNLVHDQANARSGLVDVLRSGLVALLKRTCGDRSAGGFRQFRSVRLDRRMVRQAADPDRLGR